MINVSEACELILKLYENKIYITHITDVGYGYAIGICGLNGEKYDVPLEFVDKETGKIDIFFSPHHREELRNGKIIEIPAKYKMP